MSQSNDAPNLPTEAWKRREQQVQAFEDAWRAGRHPRLDAFLPTDQLDRQAVLVELVHADLEFRLKAGDRARVSTYLKRFPELSNDHQAVTDLLVAEYRLRQAREPNLSLDEYLQRYPDYRNELVKRFGSVASDSSNVQRPAPAGQLSQMADSNLLFGILALQLDFISRDALVTGMNAWVMDKKKPLGQILVAQGVLGLERHALLEALVQEHLKQHDNDPHQSLAALSSLRSARQDLERIVDPDMQASLGHVSAMLRNGDPPTGPEQSVGESTSAGLRFRVLRPHARGALGQVSVARDEELHRDVALKEIQVRYADDASARARFLQEAGITGSLEHPGIVPVYGLGTYADGRPFYAMRFIKGDNLKQAIARFHGSADRRESTPSERNLEFRQLLRRFVDVCNAVSYAHSRGVLHRDLKPGNIMLGKYGETLVVDWGLAKAVGRISESRALGEVTLKLPSGSSIDATVAGAVLGTPAYMSPEQGAGKLDALGPASDIYSLGATLYTVLTGKAPFPQSDVEEVLVAVQKGLFLAPRQVDSDVPRALETICLRAMAFGPGDRYVSARALADDIEHWLADEPVQAYAEPWHERARRWMRRHRPLMAAVTVGLAILAMGGVTSTWLAGRAIRAESRTQEALLAESGQRRRAEEERDRAVHAEASARANEDKARAEEQKAHVAAEEAKRSALVALEAEKKASASQATTKALNNFLINDLLGEANPDRNARAKHITVEEVIGRAADKIDRAFPGQPEVEATVRAQVGEMLYRLGQYQKALDQLKKALSIRTRLLGADHEDTLYIMNLISEIQNGRGNYEEALQTARPAEAAAYRSLGPKHPATMWAMNELAHALLAIGRMSEAEPILVEQVRIRRETKGKDDSFTLTAMNNLARCYLDEGKFADAEAHFRTVVKAYRGVLPNDVLFPMSLTNMGRTLTETGKLDEARKTHDEAIKEFVRIQGPTTLTPLLLE